MALKCLVLYYLIKPFKTKQSENWIKKARANKAKGL